MVGRKCLNNKQSLIRILRKLKLLSFIDILRFQYLRFISFLKKISFNTKNPGIKLPPDSLIYETFGKLDYHSYYFESQISTKDIIGILEKNYSVKNIKICEWGCGPARLIRHFRGFIGNEADLYGTDYNSRIIEWCQKNIKDITFIKNELHPPLNFESNFFDIIYCVSVFTHLSKELQNEWLNECLRILKPGGIFYFTVHGDSFITKLLNDEKKIYDNEGFLIRGNIGEGRKNFISYNSPSYIKNVFLKGLNIIDYYKGEKNNQDIWVIKK